MWGGGGYDGDFCITIFIIFDAEKDQKARENP